jgi:hypothetical protein
MRAERVPGAEVAVIKQKLRLAQVIYATGDVLRRRE